jgi:23S rRNA (cytosine1962-C5)-methyltransferase
MSELPVVQVSRKGAARVAAGHPWVFSSDVTSRGSAQPGDAVQVAGPAGKTLGTALYSAISQITLRLLSTRVETIDAAFFERRLRDALAYRKQTVRDSDACRLVFSEADGLPGLTVDRYADVLVLQTQTQAMARLEPLLVELLVRLLEPRAVVLRNDTGARQKEGLPLEKRVAWGELAAAVAIRMNGLSLTADPLAGQKTGIYLDQRENYRAVGRLARGRALDCFTSTGGFALHMAPQCESVEAVDSSAEALQTARQNADANSISNIGFRQADAFDLLAAYARAQKRFETIVLDPPAFAKNRSAVAGALRGYKDINLRALKLLERGGLLVTCSCSHHVSEADLLAVVAEAALDAGRTLRVRERRAQASDHPILLTVPETLYLKCLLLEAIE